MKQKVIDLIKQTYPELTPFSITTFVDVMFLTARTELLTEMLPYLDKLGEDGYDRRTLVAIAEFMTDATDTIGADIEEIKQKLC